MILNIVDMRFTIKLFFFLIFSSALKLEAQELFTYTEPASNMPARSIGLRLTGSFMPIRPTDAWSTHVNPEIMVGISKKWMFHAEGFLSNAQRSFDAEGGSLYIKHRFYSYDELHSHFRLAAIGRIAINNSDIHQEAVDLNGHNSGVELGLIATKLMHKVAISANVSYIKGSSNLGEKFYTKADETNRRAIGYSLSFGKLMLPKSYENYNQINVNTMVECLAQTNLSSGNTYIDVAPVLQCIFKSRMSLMLGYRIPLVTNLYRTSPGGGLIRFEYNLFNAF